MKNTFFFVRFLDTTNKKILSTHYFRVKYINNQSLMSQNCMWPHNFFIAIHLSNTKQIMLLSLEGRSVPKGLHDQCQCSSIRDTTVSSVGADYICLLNAAEVGIGPFGNLVPRDGQWAYGQRKLLSLFQPCHMPSARYFWLFPLSGTLFLTPRNWVTAELRVKWCVSIPGQRL